MLPIDASPVHRAHFQTRTEQILTWNGVPVPPDGEGRYTMFHCLPVENLIRGHSKAPGSNGVLIDGSMRNGIRHGDGIGAYAYSYFPDIWCKPGDGYCVLELLAEPFFTKLKSGSAGRYVMKAPQETDEAIGSKCRLIKSLCGVVMSQVQWSCKAMVVQPRAPEFLRSSFTVWSQPPRNFRSSFKVWSRCRCE